ncbi:MAG: LuxR C-terminal-related transcriptional regulator [Syntrophobacteraceae bacterium]|jgi:DNA-binding CsgD family transcriptional regulator
MGERISPISAGMPDMFFETIFRGIDFHCNVIDEYYRIVWHNRVEGEGRRAGMFCHEFYQNKKEPCGETCPVRFVFESGEPCMVERKRLQKLPNGLSRWGEIRAFPIFAEEGRVAFVATIGFDITDRKYATEKQQRRIATLQRRLEQLSTVGAGAGQKAAKIHSPLTGRESQVLRLIAGGLSNIEIAEVLSLSPHTVKSHVIHIFNKLGANDRTEAAIIAARLKLID